MAGEQRQARKKIKAEKFKTIRENAAGIDVGAEAHYVAVPMERDEEPVRRFEAFTVDLYAMADWLEKCGIETVAMESTGVYWIPVYQILAKRGFEVCLVNTRGVGVEQKTDVKDCQWIQQLHSYGLLRPSFRPEDGICVWRSYMRHRQMLSEYAAAHIQHMQKALTEMNIQLHHVISDITGKTGMNIVRAIVAGLRDPARLAQMADPRVKSSTDTIAKALEGDYRQEHVFALQQALELYDIYQAKIQDCDARLQDYMSRVESKVDLELSPLKPSRRQPRKRKGNDLHFDGRRELYRISGVDITQIDGIDALAAYKVISEIGLDMSRWPSEKHFASWLGLSPNNRISGGKILRRSTRKVVNPAATVLRISAQGLLVSKTALGAFARRMKSKLGTASALTAIAHKLAKLIYRLLKFGNDYLDIGERAYEKQYQERVLKNLKRRAARFGFSLVPTSEVS